MEIIKKLAPSFLTILSALGFGLASPVWGQEYLVFISLIPLFILANSQRSYLSLAKEGYWGQIFFCFMVFFWVPVSFSNLWDNSWVFNALLFLTICSFVEFQFLIFIPGVKLINSKTPVLARPFLIATLYTVVDAIYPKFFKDTLAHAFWEQTNFLSHFNFYGGSYLATFIIVLINLGLYHLFTQKKYKTMAFGYLTALLVVYLMPAKSYEYNKKVTVYTVNTDFTFKDKKEAGYNQKVFNSLLDALSMVPENSVVIFPETIYPYDYLHTSEIKAESLNLQFRKKIMERKLNVFLGNVTTINDKKINVIMLIREDGSVSFGTKQKLFPFGEYIPFDWIPGFTKLFPPTMVDPAPLGEDIFEVNGVRYASAICYESIFSSHLRDLKQKQAQVVLNISNETWFGYFGEPQLSFALSIFSSIENDLPIVRASNGGTGGLIQDGIEDYFLVKDKMVIKSYELKIK